MPKPLADLPFDDVELLRDFIKERLGYKVIRHGLPGLSEVTISPTLGSVLAQLPFITYEDLTALLDIVVLLCRALTPVESLQRGRGTLEAKRIQRPKIVDGELTTVLGNIQSYVW